MQRGSQVDRRIGRVARLVHAGRRMWVMAAPSAGGDERSLRLPEVAIDALMRTQRRGELVWPGSGGDPMPASSFCTRWAAMRRRAGIRPVNFHALRHTAATLALEDGISPHVVAAMLGHASVATTLGVYAHVTHVSLDALTQAINSRHHVRDDVRVISGETTPRDEGTNEGTELKPRFPSTGKECRERCRVSRHIGRMSQDIVDTHVWRGCRYGSGALCGGRGAVRWAQPH